MEMNQLKKMLAGLSIASLIAGSSFAVSGCTNGQTAGSGAKPGAGSTQTDPKSGQTAGSGTKPGAGSTEQKPAAPSSGSGTKTPAPSSGSGKK